jgi:AraC-like DNA-binding protein
MHAASLSWHKMPLPATDLAAVPREDGRAVESATEPPIPAIHFDASDLRPREQFEAWRAYHAGLYDICPLEEGPPTSTPQASPWRVGSIVVAKTAYPALSFRRDRALIKQSDDRLSFRLYKSGGARAVLDGEPFEMQPGEFHLIDAQRPFHGIDAAARLGAAIPYAAIGYEPTRHAARFSLRADTPAGRLLSAGLETVFAQAPRASADDGAALAAGFVALLRGVLFPATADDAARSAVERTRAAAIRRYVDAHFTDATISAEAVGGAVGASRATVYRVFMPEGGFERAVLDRRLRAAANELSQTPARRGAVVAVAGRWGFYDPAWFTRLCRERLGCPPSDILGLAAPADQEPALAPLRYPVEGAVSRLRDLFE